MVAIFVGTLPKPLRWRMEVIQKQPKRDLAHGRSPVWSLVQRALKHLKVGQVETPCLILVNLTGGFKMIDIRPGLTCRTKWCHYFFGDAWVLKSLMLYKPWHRTQSYCRISWNVTVGFCCHWSRVKWIIWSVFRLCQGLWMIFIVGYSPVWRASSNVFLSDGEEMNVCSWDILLIPSGSTCWI